MYCYKPTNSYMQSYHYIKVIIDNKIKCLCGKEFDKSEVVITKSRPRVKREQDRFGCSKCSDKLEAFWKENVKIFKKVTNRLHSVNGTDNLVEIKHET